MSSRRATDEFALLVADVFETAGALRRYGDAIASSVGQTQARWQVMSVVSDGDWTVPAAADRLGVSRQAVQRIAGDLVDSGLARYEKNPRHRRSPFLRLTETGDEVLEAIRGRAARRHRRLARSLGDIDIAGIRADLDRLTDAVRAELENG